MFLIIVHEEHFYDLRLIVFRWFVAEREILKLLEIVSNLAGHWYTITFAAAATAFLIDIFSRNAVSTLLCLGLGKDETVSSLTFLIIHRCPG